MKRQILTMVLTICCLCTMCFPVGSFAATKTMPAPKNVKIVTDQKFNAGTGTRIIAKYKKVKGADGYQIKTKMTYGTHPGQSVKTFKTTTKNTKKVVTRGYDYEKVTIQVRAYKKNNGKKTYGKWSKVKTKKFDY